MSISGLVFTKHFQAQNQDQAQVSKLIISALFTITCSRKLDMVVLDLNCISLKNMLETFTYIKIDPVI